jgi:ketosteroid isomerase-like protein
MGRGDEAARRLRTTILNVTVFPRNITHFKPLWLLIALAFAVPPLVESQVSGARSTRPNVGRSDVIKLEKQWKEAYLESDARVLSRILADDYLGIDSLGRVTNKEEELKRIRPASGYTFAAIESDEVQVRSYGETIVVTGRSMVKLRHADQYLIGRFRYTHVYVRQMARWQVVAAHLTQVSE